MMKFKNKSGELTTRQIVILIIVITSFVIILFLLLRLNLGKETDKELCHNSVVMRGNSVVKNAVSLNCKTSYVCISEDGSCEQMTKPEIKKVKTKKDVYEALADEMADCWWMFGEGKVDYVGSEVTRNNYCSICSQIAFDDSVKEIEDFEDGVISKDDLYDYLSETKMSNEGNTYSEYLFGTNDIESLKSESMEKTDQTEVGTFGEIEIDKHYYNIMGITSEVGNTYKWIGGIGAVAGVAIGFTPVGWTVGAIVIGLSVATGVGGEIVAEQYEPEILALIVKGDGIDNEFMAPTLIEASFEKFNSLGCEDIKTLA